MSAADEEPKFIAPDPIPDEWLAWMDRRVAEVQAMYESCGISSLALGYGTGPAERLLAMRLSANRDDR